MLRFSNGEMQMWILEERKQVSELKQISFWKWSYVGGSLVKFDIGKLIAVQIFAIAVRILQPRAIRKLLSVLAENAPRDNYVLRIWEKLTIWRKSVIALLEWDDNGRLRKDFLVARESMSNIFLHNIYAQKERFICCRYFLRSYWYLSQGKG